jgi:hypothetical protein
MSKLSDIMKGYRAIKKVALPLVNVPSFINPDVPELAAQRESDRALAIANGEPANPDEIMVGLRILTLNELALVYQKAGDFARERGVKEPNETDPIYNLGVSVYICAIACVDPDSDVKNPEPFFGARGDIESAARELLDSIHIGRDGIAYLAEQHEAWQDLCNPQANKVPPSKFYELIVEMADKNTDVALKTFLALRPGMRFRLACFTASLLKTLHLEKFSPGVTSAEMSPNGSESQS